MTLDQSIDGSVKFAYRLGAVTGPSFVIEVDVRNHVLVKDAHTVESRQFGIVLFPDFDRGYQELRDDLSVGN
ncbi:MAG: hypothetical protein ACLQVD_17855 [Capsulimonadaceae bacterium]